MSLFTFDGCSKHFGWAVETASKRLPHLMTSPTKKSPKKELEKETTPPPPEETNESDYEAEEEEDGEPEEEEEIEEETDPADNAQEQVHAPKKRRGRPPKSAKKARQRIVPHLPSNEDDGTDTMAEDKIDAKGEEKIDADGKLLGGREFKFPVFTLPRHPTRLYSFSLDASKALGFRDTYIFFLRNTTIKRINGSDADREYLTENNMLPPPMKNRNITLVTARNVFRVFGHQVIKRGRPIRDDYFVGDKVEPEFYEEPMQVEDDYSNGMFDFDKSLGSQEGGPFNRRGESILGFSRPSEDVSEFVPASIPPQLGTDPWVLKCASSTADFNRRLIRNRPVSCVDLHTNIEQVSQITQPSCINVERLVDARLNFVHVRGNVVVKNDKSTKISKTENNGQWTVVSKPDKEAKFPVALLRDQHQDQSSLFILLI